MDAASPATSTRSPVNKELSRRAGPALELRDVEVVYERRGRERVRAVAGASLTVERGQIVGLVGESGCGKSSLARASVGLVRTSGGTVLFEGRDVTPLTRRARPRDLVGLQMVFQNPYSSLNPRRKIGSQLADALDVLDVTPRRDRRARVEELLDLVGLPSTAAVRYPHQFSGGQRQRIAVARSLAADPSVLVLDEPLASLDASAQAQVANLLVDLSRRLSLSLLLISHDLAIVRHVADVVSVMYLGVMVETGPTQPLWSLPLHPYTEALIGAVPHPDGSGFLPEALPGEVPDPARPPTGCRFHPRCPYAFDRCTGEEPTLVTVTGGRTVACWLQEENGPQARPADQARRLELSRGTK
jgi:oligopeptide/dipeptide ABC transporter ATP-binding protein